MRSEEMVGVLFVGRIVVLLVSIIAVMASPDVIGAVALSCALCVSAIFSTLFTSGQIALRGEAAVRALSTHYYIDVILGIGVVSVALIVYAKMVLVALIFVGLFAGLLRPHLSLPTPNTSLYVLGAIAVVASAAIGVLPWGRGGIVTVIVGLVAVAIASGLAVRGQARTMRLLRQAMAARVH